jgi:hypothetical protein
MRLVVSSMLLSAALVTQAHPQDITLNGLVRSVSLFQFIGQTCSQVSKVNVKRAHDYQSAFMDTANKSFGQTATAAALKSELKRRQNEIQTAGAGPWCQSQSTYLHSIGVNDVIVS